MSKKLAKTTRHISWQSKLTQHPNMVKAKFTRHQLKTWPKLTYFVGQEREELLDSHLCTHKTCQKTFLYPFFSLAIFSGVACLFTTRFFFPSLQLNCRQIFYLVSKKSQQLKITNQHFSSRFVSFLYGFCLVFVVILPLG